MSVWRPILDILKIVCILLSCIKKITVNELFVAFIVHWTIVKYEWFHFDIIKSLDLIILNTNIYLILFLKKKWLSNNQYLKRKIHSRTRT